MAERDASMFTVAVFQDASWAERGVEALKKRGFARESMSIIAKESPEAIACAERIFGAAPARVTLPRLGAAVATGALIHAIDLGGDLSRLGLSASFKHVGFQAHDGQIYEALTARGGVLVAIEGEPRAADALAVFHSFGGANAAIGAWSGRV